MFRVDFLVITYEWYSRAIVLFLKQAQRAHSTKKIIDASSHIKNAENDTKFKPCFFPEYFFQIEFLENLLVSQRLRFIL